MIAKVVEMPSPKVVLVTGCSEGGIGSHLCDEFARKGCTVFATARNVAKLSNLPNSIHKLALDITCEESVHLAVQGILNISGRIDILVNNAGVECVAPLVEISMDEVMSTFNTNTFGALRMIQAVSPHMMERKQGLIINVSSIVARMPPPFSGPYNASKAALSALTDTLDMELRPFGVSVMLLSTGLVRSRIADNYASHTGVKLPSESAYSAYSEQVEGRLHLSQEVCMDTAVFAKKVVRQVLKKNPPPYLTLGGNSATVGILESIPRSWRLYLVWIMFTRWTGLMRRVVSFMSIFE